MLIEDFLDIARTKVAENSNIGTEYQRIYLVVRQAILEGHLSFGSKLPTTRALAEGLGMSRSTVVNAYEWLKADGLLESRQGSGTYVSCNLARIGESERNGSISCKSYFKFSNRSQPLLDEFAAFHSQSKAVFMPGLPDLSIFPEGRWTKTMKAYSNIFLGAPNDAEHVGGYRPLRKAVANHLKVSRGIYCDSDQIIVTNSFFSSVRLIFDLMCDIGDSIRIEDPGFTGVKSAAKACQLTTIFSEVDELGAIVPNKYQEEKLIYLTPAHQFPLGMQMSIRRRREHLDYVKKNNAWIIEDDYDSEFPVRQGSLPAMMGLLGGDRVIYLGSFSKCLSPYLRIGYIVVPKELMHGFLRASKHFAFEPSFATQAALADFIDEGHFHRHIRKMRTIYREKLEIIRDAIDKRLSDYVYKIGHNTGLHITIIFKNIVDDCKISHMANMQGLGCLPLSSHYKEGSKLYGLVLGYGYGSLLDLNTGIKKLERILKLLS